MKNAPNLLKFVYDFIQFAEPRYRKYLPPENYPKSMEALIQAYTQAAA
jgi:hypothetical protein